MNRFPEIAILGARSAVVNGRTARLGEEAYIRMLKPFDEPAPVQIFGDDRLRPAANHAIALAHEDADFVMEPAANRNAGRTIAQPYAPRKRNRRAPRRTEKQRRIVVKGVSRKDKSAARTGNEKFNGVRTQSVLHADKPT